MKPPILTLLGLLLGASALAQTKNLLSGRFGEDELGRILAAHEQWRPFPKIDDRAGWARANREMMRAYVKKAGTFLDYDWPAIPATKSLLIERTGDRDEYQAISLKKREVLGSLLLAEISENQGRFIDPIINGVWSICEESFWGVPAHLPKTREFSGLMDVSQPFVELFSAETASFLAWVDYYLGARLDAVSPQIRKRIQHEVDLRIFRPLMTRHHGFMGPNAEGRGPNNWNPWICSNWLNAVLCLEKDRPKRTAAVAKILRVLDEFLNPYPPDGGCDEGPGYWGAAAASLYDCILLLNLATDNAFAYVFRDEKFRNMGRYIYRAQISPRYFVNFGDTDPEPGIAAGSSVPARGPMIYRFGRDIADADMMRLGAYYRPPKDGATGRSRYTRNFLALFIQQDYENTPPGLPLPQDVWLPDLQVMIARDRQGSTDGFFVAAKGGHNGESHNHNDVGNYVVYYNGSPLLIDVGRGTYTRRSFSDQRYAIWYNSSDHHNVPTINRRTQQPGANFKATGVSCQTSATSSVLTLDLARAYPGDAGVNSWIRSIRLNRGESVRIDDAINLTKAESIVQHLMTCHPAEVLKAGELVIRCAPDGGTAKDFVVSFDPAQFEVAVEKIKLESLEDKGVREKWGDTIRRVNLTAKSPKTTDHYSLSVRVR